MLAISDTGNQGSSEAQSLHAGGHRYELEGLKGLEALSLLETHITDKGLACLQGKTRLRWLSLALTATTDVGMAHLREATELRWLNLDCTDVSGEGLAHLKKATWIEWLRLSGHMVIRPDGTASCDAGLRHLMGMKELKDLDIGGMEASEAGMRRLLHQAKSLEAIQSQAGAFGRDGWKTRESISDKLLRVKEIIRDNIKE